ncbi:hypothetical protein JOD43_003446 [Pullulanibacillus pueri]|nr:hypothetical protein [Pullulanibacillus pueri]
MCKFRSRSLAFLMPTGLRKATKRIFLAEKSCFLRFFDVGRIGVVTGRDDFDRSSLVASANFGVGLWVLQSGFSDACFSRGTLVYAPVSQRR